MVHLAAMFLITFYCPCKAEFLHQQHEENEQGRSDDEIGGIFETDKTGYPAFQ